MNPMHFHLLLNHLPIMGVPLVGALLLFGLMRRSREIQRATLAGFVILALGTVPVFLTGEPAEEGVKELPGVAESAIDRHQDLGTVAFGLTEVLGTVALLGLVVSRKERPVPRLVAYGVVALTVLSFGALAPTGYTGGQIRHSEIRAADGGAGGEREVEGDEGAVRVDSRDRGR